ncbi:hypothetical protein BV898_19617 [Hypsibius exemplaris]|uniref:Secreted protein n=1 Tax=Hypsibius exemplaris TaxID=2072580 RepID=A0A9X6NL78_HYPEX|nr:hypothetical protein BV898_19617 [Hypsibius exemplaris]
MKYLACLAFFGYAWHLTVGMFRPTAEKTATPTSPCALATLQFTNPPGAPSERGSWRATGYQRRDFLASRKEGHGHGSPLR